MKNHSVRSSLSILRTLGCTLLGVAALATSAVPAAGDGASPCDRACLEALA